MARIKQQYIESYLVNKLFEALKPLNEVKDALDPSEIELIAEIDRITKEIVRIEI
ncbi:MAG TPA: hypothetical protein VEI28_01210 [Thermodesulfovibrionales bacterium]|nr:hypothetical protein [Thermodesulfovibrionales bacterium]